MNKLIESNRKRRFETYDKVKEITDSFDYLIDEIEDLYMVRYANKIMTIIDGFNDGSVNDNDFILYLMPHVFKACLKVYDPDVSIDFEELVSNLLTGVIESSMYKDRRINGFILMFIDNYYINRITWKTAYGICSLNPDVDALYLEDCEPESDSFDELMARDMLASEVFHRLADGLTERERYIMIARANGATLDDLGRQFHLTRERIRQIEVRTLKKSRNICMMRRNKIDINDILEG